MTSKTTLLAWIHIVLGAVGLLVGGALCVGLALSRDPKSVTALQWVGPPFLLIAVFYLLPALVGGLGLRRGTRAGRTLIVGLSVLLLLLIPVGTALGAWGLWVLLGGGRGSGSGAQPGPTAPATPPAPPPRTARPAGSPAAQRLPFARHGALLLTIAGVGAAMALLLRVGFLIHHQTPPPQIEQTFVGACVVLALVLAAFLSGRWFRHPLSGSARWMADVRAAELRDSLAPDDRESVATCVHLRPIERAMRRAGIEMHAPHRRNASGACRINREGFERSFGAEKAALYAEPQPQGREREDPLIGRFTCPACRSNLYVVHPTEATEKTPWFPAPPGARG